jgi:hypothetical protein
MGRLLSVREPANEDTCLLEAAQSSQWEGFSLPEPADEDTCLLEAAQSSQSEGVSVRAGQ